MPTVYGWVTLDEAEDYFETRLNADVWWNSGTDKIAALVSAYYSIKDSDEFSISDTEDAETVKRAQYEQTIFLLIDGQGLERRRNLIAQGVVEARFIKEIYREDAVNIYPLADNVRNILKPYKKSKNKLGRVKRT